MQDLLEDVGPPGPVELGTGDTTLASVEIGETLTIQSLHFSNRNAATKTALITVSESEVTDLLRHIVHNKPVETDEFLEFGAGMKIKPTDAKLYVIGKSNATVSISVTLSGTLRKPQA